MGNGLEGSTLGASPVANCKRNVNKKYIRIVNAERKGRAQKDTTWRPPRKNDVFVASVGKGGIHVTPRPQAALQCQSASDD